MGQQLAQGPSKLVEATPGLNPKLGLELNAVWMIPSDAACYALQTLGTFWKFSSPSSGNKYLLTASLSNLSPFSNLSVSFSAQRTFPALRLAPRPSLPARSCGTLTKTLGLVLHKHTPAPPHPSDPEQPSPGQLGRGSWLWQSPLP